MRRSYLLVLFMIVVWMTAYSAAAQATEYLTVSTKIPGLPYNGNCLALMQMGGISASLEPGMIYTVSCDGNARANPMPHGEFDGLFLYYYDFVSPNHPVIRFLPKGEEITIVASGSPFWAFLVDKTLKDVADNTGSLTVLCEPASGTPVEINVNAVFNCVGLEDQGAAKIVLVPYTHYVASVTGDGATNGYPEGAFDGVCMFYRRVDEDPTRPTHPILKFLEYGEEIEFTIHVTGWVYAFFVDDSIFTMGNNSGAAQIEFQEVTAVEESTWGSIKALYR